MFVNCLYSIQNPSAPSPLPGQLQPQDGMPGAPIPGGAPMPGAQMPGGFYPVSILMGGGVSSSKELFQELVALHANCYEWN